jgi:hypothetical protein
VPFFYNCSRHGRLQRLGLNGGVAQSGFCHIRQIHEIDVLVSRGVVIALYACEDGLANIALDGGSCDQAIESALKVVQRGHDRRKHRKIDSRNARPRGCTLGGSKRSDGRIYKVQRYKTAVCECGEQVLEVSAHNWGNSLGSNHVPACCLNLIGYFKHGFRRSIESNHIEILFVDRLTKLLLPKRPGRDILKYLERSTDIVFRCRRRSYLRFIVSATI